MRSKYLTKSLFKQALECPTKLYYAGKREYANKQLEDTFLESLANGGFQVGYLARCYFPGGHLVENSDYEAALNQTKDLMKLEQVIIYEAAFNYRDLFIKADILVKNGDQLRIIEVKAKSVDDESESDVIDKHGKIKNNWREYIGDIAFQKFVVSKAFPEVIVSASLMMPDKTAQCPTDGLNQKFRIARNVNGGKKVVISTEITDEDLSIPLLRQIDADHFCSAFYDEKFNIASRDLNFEDYINVLTDYLKSDMPIYQYPFSTCGKCQYVASGDELARGLKSGFRECWNHHFKWNDEDFNEPTVLDLWNSRSKDKYLNSGIVKLKQLNESDLNIKGDGKPGISPSQRQWLQIEKVKNNDDSYWIDIENLRSEIQSWRFPLHFIDFETSMVAIPFNRGRHPYEGIAFQFSHHIVYDDGMVEHRGQYLNDLPGVFPNYDFVRHLMHELNQDDGSVFRYAAHENTYLVMIYKQLLHDPEDIPDRAELCDFIKTVTKTSSKSEESWEGQRSMIDMCELVKRYYYDPLTNGSNSIKKVLPAILDRSRVLKSKYAQPIYGAENGVKSLNYVDWTWIEVENGKVMDPYKLLPKLFRDASDRDQEILCDFDDLRDGGAALTAYAVMQFEDMSDYERTELRSALLKYCELDTMAMVMIYEGWREMAGKN